TFPVIDHLSVGQVDCQVEWVVRPVVNLSTFDSVVRFVCRDVLSFAVGLNLVLIVTIPNAKGRLVTSFVEILVKVPADFGTFSSNLHINMSIEPSRQIDVHANNPLVIVGHVDAIGALRNLASTISPTINGIVVAKVGTLTKGFRKLFPTNTRRRIRRVKDRINRIRTITNTNTRGDRIRGDGEVVKIGVGNIPPEVFV